MCREQCAWPTTVGLILDTVFFRVRGSQRCSEAAVWKSRRSEASTTLVVFSSVNARHRCPHGARKRSADPEALSQADAARCRYARYGGKERDRASSCSPARQSARQSAMVHDSDANSTAPRCGSRQRTTSRFPRASIRLHLHSRQVLGAKVGACFHCRVDLAERRVHDGHQVQPGEFTRQ